MSRHGVPATLTSAGRIVQTWVPGPADRLCGPARWLEVWRRLRRVHDRCDAARLTFAAWRHGVALSGPKIGGAR